MRLVPLAALLPALAACDCGGFPASGPGDDPPGSIACAGLSAAPVPLHDLATGSAVLLRFSVCGHLLATVDGTDFLAGPELAALAALPAPGDGSRLEAEFAPTGELLRRSGPTGTVLLDLATGTPTALGPARDELFLPSHDLGRSILRRCTDAGLAAVDRGVERLVLRDADCERFTWTASLAPVTVAADRRERLLVADLERGTALDTGLPFVSRQEPTPEGEPAFRDDWAFVSIDGTRLLHAQRWQVFRGDTVDWEGPDELRIVETGNAHATVFPALAGDGELGFFRSGFVWHDSWNGTRLAGAAGPAAIDHRCRVERVSDTADRLLLSCYFESGPTYWRDRVVDTRDFSAVEPGGAWSVREASASLAAIAGCPVDAWRGGSCTVPTVRRWVEGNGVRDLPLDRTADVLWVGDDGSTLAIATERDEALLLDANGALRLRFPLVSGSDRLPRLFAAAGALLVQADGGSLELVVPETGHHERLAEAAVQVALDARGERVAFTVPDGDGVCLVAGALRRSP
jgi:hypothetical protein